MTPKQIIAILQDQIGAAEKENKSLTSINAELLSVLREMYDSACANATSTPSKQAFVKARGLLIKLTGAA